MIGTKVREIMEMVRAIGVPETVAPAIESLITAHTSIRPFTPRVRQVTAPGSIGELARAFHKRALRRSEITGGHSDDLTWHMLLSLTAEDALGRGIPVSTLCIDSGGPPTTALRHIAGMVTRGLVSRHPDKADARRIWIRLTDQTRERMHAMLLDFCMPLPVETPPPKLPPFGNDDWPKRDARRNG